MKILLQNYAQKFSKTMAILTNPYKSNTIIIIIIRNNIMFNMDVCHTQKAKQHQNLSLCFTKKNPWNLFRNIISRIRILYILHTKKPSQWVNGREREERERNPKEQKRKHILIKMYFLDFCTILHVLWQQQEKHQQCCFFRFFFTLQLLTYIEVVPARDPDHHFVASKVLRNKRHIYVH